MEVFASSYINAHSSAGGTFLFVVFLFIVSAGTAKHAPAFLCQAKLMVRRTQALTGCREAGRVLEQGSGVRMDRGTANE